MTRTKLLTVFLITTLILPQLIFTQEFTPVIKQFVKNDYGAANQNWSVGQASNGTMYFGNNNGLLEFDGSQWRLIRLPQNKIARALVVDSNDRIYVGSFEEFGFFEKNTTGQYSYTSLSERLSDYSMKNDEIWNIIILNNQVIFQSFTSYFIFDGHKVAGFRCPYTFLFFNKFNNNIYTHTEQQGFSLIFPGRKEVQAIHSPVLRSPVISILQYDKSRALLVTKTDGLFLFDGKDVTRFATDADNELSRADINRAVISADGTVLLGSILNGVTAISHSGKKLWTLNTSNVLQNNTVLGMYCDRDNNLWLCLDKGISFISLNATLRYIRSFSPSVGAIYSVSYDAPLLYIGTNQGLYTARFDKDRKYVSDLKLLPEIKGQVWNTTAVDGQFFCGNNEETYEIQKGVAFRVSPVKGGFCFAKGTIQGQEVLVQGTYTELCIYLKKNGKWAFSHTVQGFLNPVRYIEIDYTGTIWATHLHQGMYAIRLKPNLKEIESIQTFNSLDNKNKLNINAFAVNNRVIFTDHNRFYTYDDIDKKIIIHKDLNQYLGSFSQAYRICHFRGNLYWFISDDEAALVEVLSNGARFVDIVHYSLFLNQTVDDYQNVIPVSDKECLFTLENGIALYHTGLQSARHHKIKLQLKSVETTDAESRQAVYLSLSDSVEQETPYKRNTLIFTVFYPDYTQTGNLYYRYMLEGLDKVWGDPTASARKTYAYLPYGRYVLKAEVMTKSGVKLGELSYRFEVNPPFYLSNIAKFIYFILFLLLVYGIYRYIEHLFYLKKEKIHQEQEEIRRKEIEKREQQIMALENEKLESELTLKSKELAGSTMTIIKKNEILAKIKDEIVTHKNILGSQYPNKYYDKLIRMIDENLSSEDDWAVFQTNFDRIHENFFRNLHTRYPELTSNDLRFCAYLRLNLTSKDIAHLMNISLKGVEVGRYRIRKKIGLESTKSLTEFMIEFR
jgi:DNA-binding CsgD family transcriptional regulator